MPHSALADWAFASLLLSLRVAPVLAFAPPFSLTRVPALFRALLGLGLAGLMASWAPLAAASTPDGAGAAGLIDLGWLVAAAARELFVGLVFMMGLQLMFAALYTAGRTVDIQAGFGLATLIDPTSQAQTPLIGSLFAYAAGAVFFAMDGHLDLMRIVAASVDAVPIGTAVGPGSLARLGEFIGAVMAVSLGVAGGAILALFLTDLAIAMMSRTVPQMNVLTLGLQVKTILLMVVLPLSSGIWAALLARMARVTLEGLPRLL